MIGKKLRAYEITEEIGSGGMATVYRAYQPSMDRHVAVKVIRSAILHDQGLRERFQREARLIARLEHPHLLPVYDFDSDHEPPYIVMRYLEGGTLKQVQERGGVPREESLYILHQLAGALDYAHRQGVVHRDLKPSNVMIDREGNAFLTDFGIARASGGEKDLTGTGLMIGTPGYMSPEQARGDSQVDKAADIYSLGVMAFEILTGRQPFESGSAVEIIMAHINKPVPRASDTAAGVPKSVDAVLAMALAKDKTQRHATATAFVEELARALKIKPSNAPAALQNMTQTISLSQLQALAKKGESGTPSGAATPSDQQRQMTAVSVDMKEFVEVLYESGADAERAKSVMAGLWGDFAEIITKHGGVIHSRADESGLLLWGRDRSREDDPESAIRATLLLRDRALQGARTILGKNWEPSEENPLPFTAGVTTGPVLLERETATGSYTASGAPITLAARLREAAPTGSVLVAYETFTFVRGVFTFAEREPLRVRGRKDPVQVYVAQAIKPRAFRLRARGIEGVETKMIGREIELRLLQEALTLTLEDGETQVVTVVGEAGVGKSRLLFEFNSWMDLQEQDVWFFQARATQPSMLQPYSLTRDLFSFRFQILDSDSLSAVHEKFVKGIEGFLGEGSAEKAHFIGQLVGFDFSDKPDVEAALRDGDAFRRKAQGYLGEFFTSTSKTNPVVLHIEDIHWADDRSLDLINNLVRENTDLPLFVLCMARPSLYERRPQWGEGQRFHERIQLEPLSQLSSRRLVRELLKNVAEVPTALRDLVVERADGNPFYIEEIIKALIDDRVILKGEEAWTIDTSRLLSVRVPPTLTGVLQARLDTLPTALQQLLQRASVVGRIFWDSAAFRLSKEAAGLGQDEVQAMLDDLRDREMILQREESGFAGTTEYVFRHAILRDVTYDTVVPRQRRALHKLTGDWLLEVGGERVGEHTLLVAEHYDRADEAALAAKQWISSARRALHTASYEEAGTLLARARGTVSGPEHTALRVQIDLMLGDLTARQGHLREALARVEPAVEEARRIDDPKLFMNSLLHAGRLHMWLDNEDDGQRYTREALEIARKLDDKPGLIFCLRQLGNLTYRDKPKEARALFEESIRLAREVSDSISEANAENSLGNLLHFVDDYQAAVDAYERSATIAHSIGERYVESMANGNKSFVLISMNRFDEAERLARRTLATLKEIGAVQLMGVSESISAVVCIKTGRDKEAWEHLHNAVRADAESGNIQKTMGFWYGILMLRQGQRETGLAWIGFCLKHEKMFQKETRRELERFRDEIYAGRPEAEVEAAMSAGENLTIEAIVAQAAQEGP